MKIMIVIMLALLVFIPGVPALEALWDYPVKVGFSTPAVEDLDGDGEREVVVGSQDGGVYVLDSFGNLMWKFQTNGTIHASIMLADLEGDGDKEVIATSKDGNVYVLDGKGGLKWKFSAGLIESTPAIADINNDVKKEMFFAGYDGYLYSLDFEGNLIWKKALKLGFPIGTRASPVLADINNDGKVEVILPSRTQRLYVFDSADGKLLWTYRISYDIDATPSLGDLDMDGSLEIIVSGGETIAGIGDTSIYALNNRGDLVWKYKTGGGLDSSPALGDIDGDGKLEAVEATLKDGGVYAVNHDGSLLWKYKSGEVDCCSLNGRGICVYPNMSCKIYSTPIIADINDDGKFEVLVGSDNGKISILSGPEGKLLDQFQTEGPIRSSPLVADIEDNGILEIIIGSDKLYVLDTGAFGEQEWTMFKRDLEHSGNAEGVEKQEKITDIKNPLANFELALSLVYGDTLKWALCYYQTLGDRVFSGVHSLGLFC